MGLFDILVAVIWSFVLSVTEWLPIGGSGHLALLEQALPFSNAGYTDTFVSVVQLGAVFAVILLFWKKICPFERDRKTGTHKVNTSILLVWMKIIVSCLPAAIVGIAFRKVIHDMFYNSMVIAGALIIFGVLFIVVESINSGKKPAVTTVTEIGFDAAFIIGIFQLVATIVPGTGRAAAIIIGALVLGIARGAAIEYTFYMAIPVVFGQSILKIAAGGLNHGVFGYIALLLGLLVSFIVSLFTIKFMIKFLRKHRFKGIGIYRIVLGIVVILYFTLTGATI